MLQLLKNLRHHSQGKEIGDADILNWANDKVKRSGRSSQMESFKVMMKTLIFSLFIYVLSYIGFMWRYQDKILSTGRFFLELLSSVEPRVVNWALVTKGETGMQVLNFQPLVHPS